MANPDNHQDPRAVGHGTEALLVALNVGFRILRYLLLVMLIAYLFSGFFILGPNEQAYVLRFGRISGEPGEQVLASGRWHIALPKYMSEVVRVPTGEVQNLVTEHFWNREADRNIMTNPDQPQEAPPEGQGLNPGVDSDGYMLTADSNILHTRWQLYYYITDPIAYTTNYANPRQVIKSAMETVILRNMATVNIEDALYTGSSLLAASISEQLAIELRRLEVGVEVTDKPGLVFLDKRPPRAAQSAFNLVLEADQQQDARIEAAKGNYNRVIAAARGEQQRLILEAGAYGNTLISKAEADAAYMTSILQQIQLIQQTNQQNPDSPQRDPASILLTLYVDTILDVLNKVQSKYVVYPGQEVRILTGPPIKSPNSPRNGRP